MLKSSIQKLERALKLKPGQDMSSKKEVIIDSIAAITKYAPYIEGRRKGEVKLIWTKSMREFLKVWYSDDDDEAET
jgi:hypothetical protein